MVNKRPFCHSALTTPLVHKPAQRVEGHGCAAFVHDIITTPLPADYDTCDIFYAEIPWRAGFSEFESRAGTAHDYAEFMQAVNKVVTRFDRGILICGRTELSYLQPDKVMEARINGAKAVAAIYGDIDITAVNTWDILAECAKAYDCIGDFVCGYGRAGWVFYRHGKRFIMSDHNAQCIGYIADWLNETLSEN